MLEKYVAALLVPYLSKYFENIDEAQLRIDIWSGKASLHDLILRTSVLDDVLRPVDADGHQRTPNGGGGGANGLPLHIHRGVCKGVSISIPVKYLRSQAVVLSIDELLLTVRGGSAESPPADAASAVEDKAAKWAAAAAQKQSELGRFEAERKRRKEAAAAAAAESAEEETTTVAAKGGGGYFSRLAELVVNNIIVKVNTVHVRYEREDTRDVIGAILGGVQLLTVDEATGQVMFTDPTGHKKMFKRLDFTGLQVYCEDPKQMAAMEAVGRCWLTKESDWTAWYHAMKQRVRDGNVAYSTVFGPVSGCFDLHMVFKNYIKELITTPYLSVEAKIDHIMAHLTRCQYTSVVRTISLFTNWNELSSFAFLRPHVPVKGHAKAWWRYAIRAVRKVIAVPRQQRVLERVSQAFVMDYRVLYRDIVRKAEMTPERKKAYRFITRFMTVEDMVAARKDVYAQMATEIQNRRKSNETKKAEALAQQQQQQQPKKGWLGWMRGGSTDLTPKEVQEEEEVLKNLEKDYGIDASDAQGAVGSSTSAAAAAAAAAAGPSPQQLPPNYTWLHVVFDLPVAKYRIDMESGESATLAFFQLHCRLKTFNAPGAVQFHFAVQNMLLSNPANSFEGGRLVPNLIEAVTVERWRKRNGPTGNTPSTSPLSSEVRSLTDSDGGRSPPRSPTLREVVLHEEAAGTGTTTTSSSSGHSSGGAQQHQASSSPPHTTPRPDHARTTSGGGGGGDRRSSSAASSTPPSTPLLDVWGAFHPVEQPLPDTNLDLVVRVRLLPLRVVADPTTIDNIIRFFRVPPGLDVSNFADSTRHVAGAVSSAASQELRSAMATAKGVFLSVDVSAPIIVLPKTLRATRKEAALAVSLGRIRFDSQPLSETEKQRRLSSKQETEEMLYYSNRAAFSKLFVELTTVENALQRLETGFMLVPEVCIAADVLQRIDDNSIHREAVIVRLKLPKLRVALSLHQVYLLTDMIDAWIGSYVRAAHRNADEALVANIAPGMRSVASSAVSPQRLQAGPQGASRTRRAGVAGSLTESAEPSLGDHSPHSSPVAGASLAGGGGSAATKGDAAPHRKVSPSSPGLSRRSPGTGGANSRLSPSSPQQAVSRPPLEDAPKMRIELLVQHLGVYVYEDNPNTLAPLTTARFSLAFEGTELIFANHTLQSKMLLLLPDPCVLDLLDPTHPVLRGGTVRVDVIIPKDGTVGVGVQIQSGVNARIGTPFMELAETVMDVVNLILFVKRSASTAANETSTVPVGAPVDSVAQTYGIPPDSDLAYQLAVVREQNELPDTRVMNLSVQLLGESSIELMNRRGGEDAATEWVLLRASVCDADIFMKRNDVTFEVTGKVAQASVTLSDQLNLAAANRTLLRYSPHVHSRPPTFDTEPPTAGGELTPTMRSPRQPQPSPAAAADAATPAHVSFAYRKNRPVMPLFVEVEGKRTLVNATEVRYSTELEVELGASTVIIDLHSIMLLYRYFTTGFFTRIMALGDRPLYNGESFPPTREGPRLLMSMCIIAHDVALVMPLDAQTSATEAFSAAVGHIAIKNSLYNSEVQQSTNVSLRDITLWRDGTVSSGSGGGGDDDRRAIRRGLFPPHTFIEVAVRSDLDPLADEPLRIDVRSEEVLLDMHSDDLIALGHLIRRNFSRSCADSETVRLPSLGFRTCPSSPAVTAGNAKVAASGEGKGHSSPPSAADHAGCSSSSPPTPVNNDVLTCVRLARLTVRFLDAESGGSQFSLSAQDAAMLYVTPSNEMQVRWQSLSLLDIRDSKTSTLIQCSTGNVKLSTISTTRSLLYFDFGVRRTALTSTEADTLEKFEENEALLSPHPITSEEGAAAAAGKAPTSPSNDGTIVASHSPSHADANATELLAVTGLTLDFTLQRFAISDQWLNVYDFLCNEAVAAAWSNTATTSETTAPSTASAAKTETPPDAATAAMTTTGFRCVISTPSVVMPFLSVDRTTLAEASIKSLLVDVVTVPNATSVAVKAEELEVVDGKTGVKVISRRRTLDSTDDVAAGERETAGGGGETEPTPRASGGSGSHAAGASTSSSPGPARAVSLPGSPPPMGAKASSPGAATAVSAVGLDPVLGGGHVGSGRVSTASSPGVDHLLPSAQKEADVLHVVFRSEPLTRRNRIQVMVGQLDVICSMPLIYGFVDYCAAPSQPIAKIASLGVMREQRARLAEVAQNMADTTAVSINLQWNQPRIIVIEDGMDLRQRDNSLEARLGVMKAAVTLDRRASSLTTTVRAQRFWIPGLLEKSSLRFTYTSKAATEEVQLTMDRTVALFQPAEVDRLLHTLTGNLMLPRTAPYYDLGPVGTPPAAPATTAGAQAKPQATSSPSPLSTVIASAANSSIAAAASVAASSSQRTTTIQITALLLAIYDITGVHTHTVTVGQLNLSINPASDLLVVIPAFHVMEHFSNRYLVQSGTLPGALKPLASRSSPAPPPVPPTVTGPESAMTSAPPSTKGATTTAPASPAGTAKEAAAGKATVVVPPSASSEDVPALRLEMSASKHSTSLVVSDMTCSVVSRGLGSLVNTLLLVQIPTFSTAETAPTAPFSPGVKPASPALSRQVSQTTATAASSSTATTAAPPTAARTPVQSKLTVALAACKLRFIHGDDDIALASLKEVVVASESYADGASLMQVRVGAFHVRDIHSANSLYPEVIAPYADEDATNTTTGSTAYSPLKGPSSSPGAGPPPPPATAKSLSSSAPIRSQEALRDFVNFSLWTAAPEVVAAATAAAEARAKHQPTEASTSIPQYTKRMQCEMGNLSVAIIPDVTRALIAVFGDVKQQISEGNRNRAYDYVSDAAAATVRDVNEVTHIDITIHRPRFLLVDVPTSTRTVQLYPGTIIIKNTLTRDRPTAPTTVFGSSSATEPSSALTLPSTMTPPSSTGPLREQFNVRIDKMGVKLLDENAFKEDCRISILYDRVLEPEKTTTLAVAPQPGPIIAAETTPGVGDGAVDDDGGVYQWHLGDAFDPASGAAAAAAALSPPPPTSEASLQVSIPTLSMLLSREQTDFAMDVIGAFLVPMATGKTKSSATLSSPGVGDDKDTTPLPAATTAAKTNSGLATATTRTLSAVSAAGAGNSTTTTVPNDVMSIRLAVHTIEAELADCFRLRIMDTVMRSVTSSATGSEASLVMGYLGLQHVGAIVETAAAAANANATATGTAGSGGRAGPGARQRARVDELVNVVTLTNVEVARLATPVQVDWEHLSSYCESTMHVRLEEMKVAISPTILFDTREVLYLPFCSKVLSIPIEPIPVLLLTQDTTRLAGDVVLDDKHVLVTAQRTRCCYVLDLNQHRLVLSGAPSGQIILNEGCELTITNGAVVIPGMYTVGSFVSFAAATALFTTDTCTVVKEYQSMPNAAFAMDMAKLSLVPATNATVVRGGKKGYAVPDASASFIPGPLPNASVELGGETLVERTVRTLVDFECEEVQFQVLSEEVIELSTGLNMGAFVQFTQETENENPVRRSVSVQLRSVHSNNLAEHLVLPTNITISVSGVDNVSAAVLVDSLEFCIRATLLRSLVEVAKDFGAAFVEETSVKRVKPTVQFETDTFTPLVPVVAAGECRHCGEHNALLAEKAGTPGVLCYRCCTGRDCLPATDFRLEVPLVDVVLIASNGALAHAYLKNLTLVVDSNMDLRIGVRGSWYNFSNAAAVWEPFLEDFDMSVMGSTTTNDYRVKLDRLDFVLSPLNLRTVSVMSTDYGSDPLLQKRLRKRFRRRAAQRVSSAAPGLILAPGAKMYVESELGDEDARVAAAEDDDDEEADLAPVESVSRYSQATSNQSIFDSLVAMNDLVTRGRQGSGSGGLTQERLDTPPYAVVQVINHCTEPIAVNDKVVPAFGDAVHFATNEPTILVQRASNLTKATAAAATEGSDAAAAGVLASNVPPLTILGPATVQSRSSEASSPSPSAGSPTGVGKRASPTPSILATHTVRTGSAHSTSSPHGEQLPSYVISLSRPPLLLQGRHVLLHTSIVLQRDDSSRHLKRVVTLTAFPLHTSRTVLCYENHLICPVEVVGGVPVLQPGDRRYMRFSTDLKSPLLLRPSGTINGEGYNAGTTLDGKMPTLEAVLSGEVARLVCRSKLSQRVITAQVMVRQESIRGGVPTFTLHIGPLYELHNRLPYSVLLNVYADVTGDLAKDGGRGAMVKATRSVVVDAMANVELPLDALPLQKAAFSVEAHQGGGTGQSMEAFGSNLFSVREDGTTYVTLRSGNRREMVVRVVGYGNRIALATPFAMVNHTTLRLAVRECEKNGEVKMVKAERNFSYLPPSMSSTIAASPSDAASDELFLNFYADGFVAKNIPVHVQQRGLILLEETESGAGGTGSGAAGPAKTKKVAGKASPAATPDNILHLAYLTTVDTTGTRVVVITPRWVVVNRSRLRLYVAPSTYGGISAAEAVAAATAAVAAKSVDTSKGKGGGAEDDGASPTSEVNEVDAFTKALEKAAAEVGGGDLHLHQVDEATVVAPGTAKPLYRTPYCAPAVGYHAHILQHARAPLYGSPVALETIHNETIVAYKPDAAAVGTEAGASRYRDRFVEVSLVAREPYTYVILEDPTTAPYLVLNRTPYTLEVRDTAPKSLNRFMARVAPGCGSELILDTTVTTNVRVLLLPPDGTASVKSPSSAPSVKSPPTTKTTKGPTGLTIDTSMTPTTTTTAAAKPIAEAVFNVGRPMTPRELRAAAASKGLQYFTSYGDFGQQIVEIVPTTMMLPVAHTIEACPPSPLEMVLNLAVMTVACVLPGRDAVFAAITDLRFSYNRQGRKEVQQFSISNFQVDNQAEVSPRYDSCVLALRQSEGSAAISAYVERTIVPTKALLCFEEVRLDLAPIAVRVSDTLLYTLSQFARLVGAADSTATISTATASDPEALKAAAEVRCPSSAVLFDESPRQMDAMATRVLLERFIINPIILRIWLTRDVSEHDFFRENIHGKDAALLSMMVPSCEDVTMAAQGVVAVKRSSRLGVLLQWVLKSYTDGLLAQVRGLVLQYASSLPLIGAPLKLFSGFGTGAVRLFREPIAGLSTSPAAFAQGLAHGTAGFAQEVTAGGLGAFANLADTGSRLLSMGGGVSERDRRKQNTLTSIATGLAGVVQRPLEGAAQSGATGLMVGTAQGLFGLLANPVSGLLSDVSKATGTLGKIVKNTYIPQTHRLRPIRDFYANGGIAPWRSVVTVYEYERKDLNTNAWSSNTLLPGTDGPHWYPCSRELVLYGSQKLHVPPESWAQDRYEANFDGWTYSTKYYGVYTERQSSDVRTRRRRWAAMVRPLPYSPVAAFLRVCPGMELNRRPGPSRTMSATLASSFTQQTLTMATTVDFAAPGVLEATPASAFTQARSQSNERRSRGWSRSRHRSATNFFVDEEYADADHKTMMQRVRRITPAGRRVGVRATTLRTRSQGSDAEEEGFLVDPGMSAAEVQSPQHPREGKTPRGFGQHSRAHSHVSSLVNESMTAATMLEPASPHAAVTAQQQQRSRSRDKAASAGPPRPTSTGAGTSSAVKKPSTLTPPPPPPPQPPATTTSSAHHSPPPATSKPAPQPVPAAVKPPQPQAPKTAAPTTAVMEVYEYEKKRPLLGWSKRHLSSSWPAWQDAQGQEMASRDALQPPKGWQWVGDWRAVGGDREGWTVMPQDSNLRRRLWQRQVSRST